MSEGAAERPLLTIDLDGVICRPALGRNLGIHRGFLDPGAPPPAARVPPRWLGTPLDHARFELRRPLPEARAALEQLAGLRRLVVLTGRRTPPTRWLRRHGLAGAIEEVIVNRSGLASPHYKLEWVRRLEVHEHVDDDPRTAQLLAEQSEATVYLRDWPRNRDLEYAPGVIRIAHLGELAARIAGTKVDGPSRER